jgi:hypothetical protein
LFGTKKVTNEGAVFFGAKGQFNTCSVVRESFAAFFTVASMKKSKSSRDGRGEPMQESRSGCIESVGKDKRCPMQNISVLTL